MKILIIKTGGLGDVVRTSFIAQALKDKYKSHDLKIFWITSREAISFFLNNPYVEKVVSSENKNLFNNISFDLIINLEEDEEHARFVSALNCKKVIGVFFNSGKIDYTKETGFWFDTSLISKHGKKKADILKKQNERNYRQIIAEIAGIENYERYEPFLRLNRLQRGIAKDFLRRYNLKKTDLIIGINSGSGERWPKDLPIKTTVELIDGIYEKFNAKILLFGGLVEEERNSEILKLCKAPVISTGLGNNLVEFPAFISVCNFFITTDTLGMHIALALKKKTISLIGPTSHYEVDMYGLGEKIVAKSKCLCCYDAKCKSMQKISAKEILDKMKTMLDFRVSLVITAFKEPKIGKAIESCLNQKTNYDYDLLVSAPDEETLEIAKQYQRKYKKIKLIKDPGKGKMYALNLIIKDRKKEDILIFTDGDVYISENSVEEITNLFLDSEIGCVSGRPVPMELKKDKYGYWANFLFEAAHKLRKKAFENHDFLECSGYLWAFRGDNTLQIPLDTAEDAVIPYYLWEKGYKIGYAENAHVFIKNVSNWKDWIKQKVRTTKAHETLDKYVDTKTTPRVKTFKTEINGIYDLLKYPENLKEFYWSNLLAFSRFYMWVLVFYNSKIKKFKEVDNWERIESAR